MSKETDLSPLALPQVPSPETSARPTGSVLTFSHLSYTVKTKTGDKKLIDDVSVSIKAGELLGKPLAAHSPGQAWG